MSPMQDTVCASLVSRDVIAEARHAWLHQSATLRARAVQVIVHHEDALRVTDHIALVIAGLRHDASKKSSRIGAITSRSAEMRSMALTTVGYALLSNRIAGDCYCAAEPDPPCTRTTGSAGSTST
jgi:hypothetical protein